MKPKCNKCGVWQTMILSKTACVQDLFHYNNFYHRHQTVFGINSYLNHVTINRTSIIRFNVFLNNLTLYAETVIHRTPLEITLVHKVQVVNKEPNTGAHVQTGEAGMQQRLRQCAELERSLFPSCFSVLLRPKTQITCAAFDAGRKEAVWSTIRRPLKRKLRPATSERTKRSKMKIINY